MISGIAQTEAQRLSDKHYTAMNEGLIKKYRFEVQFNPAEISIAGYGGERLPMQHFAGEKNEDIPYGSSRYSYQYDFQGCI